MPYARCGPVADERGRILVEHTAAGCRLPRWQPLEPAYVHVVGPLNRALRRDLGLDVTTLRYLGQCQDPASGHHAYVYDMECHTTGWRPPDSHRWVSHPEWAALCHAEEEIPFVETWFAETESGELPRQRAPWAIRGWHAGAAAWFSDQARRLGTPLTGRVEQERVWGISTVLRAPAGEADLYFKASCALFRAEHAVTRTLLTFAPDRLPVVLAEDAGRGWMMMADFRSTPLHGTEEALPWETALREYARLQIASLEHGEALRAAGARERSLQALPSAFAALAHGDAALMPGQPGGLTREQVKDVRGLIPWVKDACGRLERAGIPPTIVHGDLYAGNVALSPRGPLFFDWSDAAWSHPFFDLVPFFDGDFEGPAPELRDRLIDLYLEPWAAMAAPDRLRETFDLAQAVGAAYHALSYQMVVESLEPASRCEMMNGVAHFLRRLLERALPGE